MNKKITFKKTARSWDFLFWLEHEIRGINTLYRQLYYNNNIRWKCWMHLKNTGFYTEKVSLVTTPTILTKTAIASMFELGLWVGLIEIHDPGINQDFLRKWFGGITGNSSGGIHQTLHSGESLRHAHRKLRGEELCNKENLCGRVYNIYKSLWHFILSYAFESLIILFMLEENQVIFFFKLKKMYWSHHQGCR